MGHLARRPILAMIRRQKRPQGLVSGLRETHEWGPSEEMGLYGPARKNGPISQPGHVASHQWELLARHREGGDPVRGLHHTRELVDLPLKRGVSVGFGLERFRSDCPYTLSQIAARRCCRV